MKLSIKHSILSVLLQLKGLDKWEYENIQIKSKLLAKVGEFKIIFWKNEPYCFY